jgi:hypothetical protein
VFDGKNVSRERVIGISFVDILIQAVFVLLLALIVGYVDPVEKLQIKEYEEVGKDLCKKLNKDSVEACREFIQKNEIGTVEEAKFNKVGSETCKKLGANDPEKCQQELDEALGNNSLRPCLKFNSKIQIPPSLSWAINGPDDIVFLGFSSEYFSHIKKDQDRYDQAILVEKLRGSHFAAKDIVRTFSFTQESSCFHSSSIQKNGPYADHQISKEISAIYSLRGLR